MIRQVCFCTHLIDSHWYFVIPPDQTGTAYFSTDQTKPRKIVNKSQEGRPWRFRTQRMLSRLFPRFTMLLTWAPHFRFDWITTPSNLMMLHRRGTWFSSVMITDGGSIREKQTFTVKHFLRYRHMLYPRPICAIPWWLLELTLRVFIKVRLSTYL